MYYMQCNYRQCCDVRPNTHVHIRVCVISLPELEGKTCFTVSHAPAVPSDTAGLCDMCAILNLWTLSFSFQDKPVSICY